MCIRDRSYTVPVEESIRIKTRSIMGVEIPLVEADPSGQAPTYAYSVSYTHLIIIELVEGQLLCRRLFT